jgi:putative transposase
MQRAHKIRIYPNNVQATYLRKCCGVRRFVYNWALAEWKSQYEYGMKPSAYGLKKFFNSIKKTLYPFTTEVTKFAAERAFLDLDSAFKRFFNGAGYPKFKKKGVRDSFYTSGYAVKVSGMSLKLPKLQDIKMSEELRFHGKINNAVVSTKAGKWYVSISVDMGSAKRENQPQGIVGIDLGVSKLATLSDGTVFENQRITNKFAKKLRRLNKGLARKVKGSSNWHKQKRKLQLLHLHINNCRMDVMHKFTSQVCKRYGVVGLENLNVSGMVKNRKLSKALSDVSFGEIRRQFEYKARVVLVDRFFPSTKLCTNCGQLHDMPLSKRVFKCDCGAPELDRDLHAAITIKAEIIRQGLPELA